MAGSTSSTDNDLLWQLECLRQIELPAFAEFRGAEGLEFVADGVGERDLELALRYLPGIRVLSDEQVERLREELAAIADPEAFSRSVTTAMTPRPETLPVHASLEDLLTVFRRDHVAVVVDEREHFLGLITRIDLLNHLRRKVA